MHPSKAPSDTKSKISGPYLTYHHSLGCPENFCTMRRWGKDCDACVLQALNYNKPLPSGAKVLVIGASGGCGISGVMIAKALGATVTAVCSGKNAALVTK